MNPHNVEPTDIQLKQALFNMLDLHENTEHILDTELLHLCHLVEETLSKPKQISDYMMSIEDIGDWECCHATWQQRVIALAKVKGVEI